MPANNPPDQSRVSKMVQAPFGAVSLAGGVDEGKVAGLAVFQEIIFNPHRHRFGKADAHKAAGGNGVAVADHLNGLLYRDHLAFFHARGRQGREHGVAGTGG